GLTSALIVPLAGRDGGVVGTLTLIHAESGRRYSEEDCAFLEAVADRVAVALDTAASFEQQSERLAGVTLVAEAAQRAILAPPPARVGPVALSARYLSAAREAQIGGDLYEVVRGPSSLRLLVGGAAKYSTTVVVPQARVELATFRLGGGCTDGPDLRRHASRAPIHMNFPYGSPFREPRLVPERTHRHGSAPLAHLHHRTTPTDLAAGLPTLLTIHDIACLLRLHRTAAYARTREPDFPDPLVISGSCYRWYTHEVLAYVDARRTSKTVPRPRRGEEDCSLPSGLAHPVPRVRVPRRTRHDADRDVPPAGERRSH
ncbi:GAF domain-containing protein, partial [Nocardioides sp.]|uniref:GAF domain-containing protein n=1 Tax=Nocardioides sp. TaxID=35761 RepID=UPI00260D0AD4